MIRHKRSLSLGRLITAKGENMKNSTEQGSANFQTQNHTITHKTMHKIITLTAVLLLAVLFSGCTEDEGASSVTPKTNIQTTPDQDAASNNNDANAETQNEGEEGQVADAGSSNQKKYGVPYISFEAPKGWEYRNEQDMDGPVGAIWDTKRTERDWVTKVSLQFVETMTNKGNEADAEAVAREYHKYSAECDGQLPCEAADGWPSGEFKILELPSGTKVYLSIGPFTIDKFRYSKEEDTPYSWGTVGFFHKDGYVYSFSLGDRADLYTQELDKIITTLKVK
jgi:hypothetical protein